MRVIRLVLTRTQVLTLIGICILLVVGTYWGRFAVMIGGRYVPEPLLLGGLLAWLVIDLHHCIRTIKSFLGDGLTLITAATLCCSGLMGVLMLEQNPADVYSQARAILAFLFAFHIGRRSGVDITWLIVALLAAYVAYLPFRIDAIKTQMPIWVGIVGCYMCVRRDRPIGFLATATMVILLAIWSNYRLDIATAVLYVTFYALRLSTRSMKSFVVTAVACTLLTLVADMLFLVISDFLTGPRYGQIVAKSVLLLDSVYSGQIYDGSLGVRLQYFGFVAENWIYLIAPFGLGDTQTVAAALGTFPYFNTVDSGLAFLAVHFGFFMGSIIVLLVVRRLVRSIDSLLLTAGFLLYLAVSVQILVVFELAVASGLVMGALSVCDRQSLRRPMESGHDRRNPVGGWRRGTKEGRRAALQGAAA